MNSESIIGKATVHLPVGWVICIQIERDRIEFALLDPHGDEIETGDCTGGMATALDDMIQTAKTRERELAESDAEAERFVRARYPDAEAIEVTTGGHLLKFGSSLVYAWHAYLCWQDAARLIRRGDGIE